MPQDKFTTKLIAKEVKAVNSGRSGKGQTWTLYQVIGTKIDGTPITHNLRSFVELPINEVIEVECELFHSEQYGDSYTLKPKAGTSRTDRIKKLEKQMKRVFDHLGFSDDEVETPVESSAPPPAAPPPEPEPPPPAPAEPQSNFDPQSDVEPVSSEQSRFGDDVPF